MSRAEVAFDHSEYSQAKEILRGLLTSSPKAASLWTRYNRAVLAKTGNDYLITIPKNRYRINIPRLAYDLKKGPKKYFLLDVRQPKEFAAGHLAGAINIPFRQVLNHLDRLPKPPTGKILLIICRSQHRANHVLVVLRELGYTNAYTLRNGYAAYLAWLKKSPNGMAQSRPCPIKIDRQTNKEKNKAVVVMPAEIAKIMSEADKSFAGNHFRRASILLKQALIKAPEYEELWIKYDRAVLAQAGNEYLTGVPKDRYRLSVNKFGTDYSKGPGLGNYFLLDVRDSDEFVKSHIAGSINVPFRTVLQNIDLLPKPDSGKILLIICRSQHRANHDLVVLRELGYTNAYTLQGGYHAYQIWLNKLFPGQNKGDQGNEVEEDFGC